MTWAELHREVRARLRTLSKENAEVVGCHLVMAGRLLDLDPERAYQHAQAAVRRGGRVDVVREAAGLAAYRTGRHAEALRELRTVRRISGSAEHLAVMADCERGLGRPERAVALASDPDVPTLPFDATVELAIVVSGARLDLDQPDAAVAALDQAAVRQATGLLAVRVAQARAVALEAAGRADEAAAELAGYTEDDLDRAAGNSPVVDDDIVVYDLTEDEEAEAEVHQAEDDLDRAAGNSPVVDDDIVVYDLTEDEEAEAEVHQAEDDLDQVVGNSPAPDDETPGSTGGEPATDQGEPGSRTSPAASESSPVEDDEDGTQSAPADETVRPVEVAGSGPTAREVPCSGVGAESASGSDERGEDHPGATAVAPAETVCVQADE
ncbi:MAG: hypothetical protein FWH11_14670 [Micrococcales bacterium]|nr:hypothetical protein [Micrococcales bacterium]